MNKKQLIGKYKNLEGVWDAEGAELARRIFLQDLEQLDEPQKVEIPQFVADCIKLAKEREWDLEDVFEDMPNQPDHSDLYQWFYKQGNMDIFARAWLDGYEVEKEKRYIVKIKGMGEDYNFFNFNKRLERWSLFDSKGDNDYRTHHTRKELEDGMFGWVFDCPGIEIEEVE